MTVAVVVGSLHMDMIATAGSLPSPGGSVVGTGFAMSPGGKAGNQAVQLARLGVPTALVAAVGADPLGDQLVAAMSSAAVEVDHIRRDPTHGTGASTVISAQGDYLSAIVPGASATLDRADLDALAGGMATVEVIVAQLELPAAISALVASWAAERGVPLVLNASPLAATLDAEIVGVIALAETLVVNRVEASALSGLAVESAAEANLAAEAITARYGVATVVVTLGPGGALCRHLGGIDYHPAWPVAVVDTIGSGDAFLGAWVAARLEGRPVPIGLQRATAAGALAASGAGALAAMPDAARLNAYVARGPVYRDLSRGSPPRQRR